MRNEEPRIHHSAFIVHCFHFALSPRRVTIAHAMIWTRLRALPVSAVLFLFLLLLALSHVLTRLPPAAAVSLAYGLVLLLPGWLLTRWLCADMPLDFLERVGLAFPLSLALLIVPASAVLALHLNLTAFQWAFSGLALLLGLLALRRSPISGLRSPVSGLQSPHLTGTAAG